MQNPTEPQKFPCSSPLKARTWAGQSTRAKGKRLSGPRTAHTFNNMTANQITSHVWRKQWKEVGWNLPAFPVKIRSKFLYLILQNLPKNTLVYTVLVVYVSNHKATQQDSWSPSLPVSQKKNGTVIRYMSEELSWHLLYSYCTVS